MIFTTFNWFFSQSLNGIRCVCLCVCDCNFSSSFSMLKAHNTQFDCSIYFVQLRTNLAFHFISFKHSIINLHLWFDFIERNGKKPKSYKSRIVCLPITCLLRSANLLSNLPSNTNFNFNCLYTNFIYCAI